MPVFATCASCHGFLPDLRAACVHCGAAPLRNRSLIRAIASALLGVTSTVTLMACYGVPPKDECLDPDACGAEPCDTSANCDVGQFCSAHPQSTPGECTVSSTCSADNQCALGMHCNLQRTTCEPNPPAR